ncbi:hypothetical protein [Candidatus Nitrosocosmicus sp. T]
MIINQKYVNYILVAFLFVTGIVYFVVANGEYEDFKELSEFGIQGELAEKQIEMAFFISVGIVNFILGIWVLKSNYTNTIPHIVVIIISIGLIVTYIASRTIGVPVIGVEYYVGRLDMISKIFQVIVVALSAFSIYNIRQSNVTIK